MQKSGERTFHRAVTTSRCSKEGTSLATHYFGKILNFTAASCFICLCISLFHFSIKTTSEKEPASYNPL